MGITIRILKDFAANGQGYPTEGEQGYSNFLRSTAGMRIRAASLVGDLQRPSASASWRIPRTPSAACILESGTRESRGIPFARGRCAGSRGRSSCRSREG
jgi:hypothetical protein